MIHSLKTWPRPFAVVKNGAKKFEFRKNDRNFAVDDVLILQEWDPDSKLYTGQELQRRVTYILRGPSFGVPEGYVIMSIAE